MSRKRTGQMKAFKERIARQNGTYMPPGRPKRIQPILVVDDGRRWGELSEWNDLDSFELMALSLLCHEVSTSRVEYLVNLYNARSGSMTRVEKHFVARYAARNGYRAVGDGWNTTFKKV